MTLFEERHPKLCPVISEMGPFVQFITSRLQKQRYIGEAVGCREEEKCNKLHDQFAKAKKRNLKRSRVKQLVGKRLYVLCNKLYSDPLPL